MRRGIRLRDGITRPAIVERIDRSAFTITITEGRNRQVRRMVAALGAKVLKLMRIAIGPIVIGDLAVGASRELTATKVAGLQGCLVTQQPSNVATISSTVGDVALRQESPINKPTEARYTAMSRRSNCSLSASTASRTACCEGTA